MRFVPLLAGASLPDRLRASLGAVVGTLLTAAVCLVAQPLEPALLFLVAPMGASAVLIFAVPASPLAQPWPVIGGNVISALIGVAVAHWVPSVPLAAGLAVGGAILAMSLTRCLHPPGGAAALTAVIGGPAILQAGYAFPLAPVGVNAMVLVAVGILFHRLSGHSYPHRPAQPAPLPPAFHAEDLDRALAEMGETFDIAREDLDRLFARVESHAAARRAGRPRR